MRHFCQINDPTIVSLVGEISNYTSLGKPGLTPSGRFCVSEFLLKAKVTNEERRVTKVCVRVIREE